MSDLTPLEAATLEGASLLTDPELIDILMNRSYHIIYERTARNHAQDLRDLAAAALIRARRLNEGI